MFPFKKNKEVTHIDETIIIIDGEKFHKHDHEEKELAIIKKLIDIINKLTRPPTQHERIRLILKTILDKNNSIFQIMALNLNTGQFSIDSLGLIDSDTGNPVSATFANATFTSSDPAVFTTEQDAANPNSTKDTAVAAGSASLTATADVTYTDANTQASVTKSLSVTIPVIVSAVVAGENVALVINQGAPQG